MRNIFIATIAFLLLIVSPASANAENDTLHTPGMYYYCPHVIDGDTIIVIIEGRREKIRLIGVDAPETDGPYTEEDPFGKEASAFTRKMAEGKNVRLEYDRQQRDRYGRILAYVYFEDGSFLNAEIIRQGYAAVLRKFPFKYRDDFEKYEREARENKKGIWKE